MWCNQMHVSASVDGFWNIYVNLLRSKWNKHYCWQRRTWIGTHCVLLPFLWWKMTKQELRIIHLMPQHAVQCRPVLLYHPSTRSWLTSGALIVIWWSSLTGLIVGQSAGHHLITALLIRTPWQLFEELVLSNVSSLVRQTGWLPFVFAVFKYDIWPGFKTRKNLLGDVNTSCWDAVMDLGWQTAENQTSSWRFMRHKLSLFTQTCFWKHL